MRLKSAFINLLPARTKRELYRLKSSRTYHVQPLEGVAFDLEAHSGSAIWRERLSTLEGHEVGLCRWFQRNLRPEDIVFEVGSCFAYFPSLLSVLQPEVRIHTFEPNWKLNAFVSSNARRNSRKHPWKTNELFVCDQSDGETQVSLDDYRATISETPSIVKIDVDGPEELVLKGAKNLIDGRKTQFLVEVHPNELPKFQGSIQGVLEQFPRDYRIAVLTDIRESGDLWSDDLSLLDSDDNPYISAAPNEIFRE